MRLNRTWTPAKASSYKNIISRWSRRTGAAQPGQGNKWHWEILELLNHIPCSGSAATCLFLNSNCLHLHFSLYNSFLQCEFTPQTCLHFILKHWGDERWPKTPTSVQQALLSYQHYSNEHFSFFPSTSLFVWRYGESSCSNFFIDTSELPLKHWSNTWMMCRSTSSSTV